MTTAYSNTPTMLSSNLWCGRILAIMCRARRDAERRPVDQGIYPRSKWFVAACSAYFERVGKCVFFFRRCLFLVYVNCSLVIYNIPTHIERMFHSVMCGGLWFYFHIQYWVLTGHVCILIRIICNINRYPFFYCISFFIWEMSGTSETKSSVVL